MKTHVHLPYNSHLSTYITMIWENVTKDQVYETILPQGMIEIIFNLEEPVVGLLPHEKQAKPSPVCFVQGLYTHSIYVRNKDTRHLFGMRLRNGMVRKLLGVHPSELKNAIIDLHLLKPEIANLWYPLKEAVNFNARLQILEKELPNLFADDCQRTNALWHLFQADGVDHFLTIKDLTRQVFYSSRHLNRKSRDLFGVSAEELIGYKKFMHATRLLHTDANSLTTVAYHSGYCDQAHFCHTFKSLSGITPSEYRRKKSPFPFHILQTQA